MLLLLSLSMRLLLLLLSLSMVSLLPASWPSSWLWCQWVRR
jgi:hypothetical protein